MAVSALYFDFAASAAFCCGQPAVLPVEWLRYRRSAYYAKTKEKYHLYITTTVVYRLLNALWSRGAAVEVYQNQEGNTRLRYNGQWVITGWYDELKYDRETGGWYADFDVEPEEEQERYLLEELLEAGWDCPKEDPVLILVQPEHFEEEDLPLARQEPRFLLCETDRDAAKALCEYWGIPW